MGIPSEAWVLLKGRRGEREWAVIMCSFYRGKVRKAPLKCVMMPVRYLTTQFGVPDQGMLGGFAMGTGKEDSPNQSADEWGSGKTAVNPRRGQVSPGNMATTFPAKQSLTLPWTFPTVRPQLSANLFS